MSPIATQTIVGRCEEAFGTADTVSTKLDDALAFEGGAMTFAPQCAQKATPELLG
jgi:hypothetical protein